MTAEVGVMNRLAVALAADSAVTFGGPVRKIYSSADKLFQLAADAPVGIMVYGNASYGGLPWEVIIKEFRRAVGKRKYGRISQYADAFVRFLTNSTNMFAREDQDATIESLAMQVFGDVEERIKVRIEKELKARKVLDDALVLSVSSSVVEEVHANLLKLRLLPYLRRTTPAVVRRYSKLIARVRDQVFSSLPMLPDTRSRLVQVVVDVLVREGIGILMSGVVVAGFGESESTPSLVSLAVDGVVLGAPRYRQLAHCNVNHKANAWITPFAQGEMVHLFMEGIDQFLDGMVKKSAADAITKMTNVVIEEAAQRDKGVGSFLATTIPAQTKKAIDTLFSKWDEHRRNNYSHPVMTVVASLPKDELAAMAEMLVNLTRFKRRVSIQEETVGGPIDVAVITKGDGFVWVRRKHYFDPALNPRIMRRYQMEGQ